MSLIPARSGTTLRLDAAWCDGHQHQKSGVVVGKFISQRMAQLNLFRRMHVPEQRGADIADKRT